MWRNKNKKCNNIVGGPDLKGGFDFALKSKANNVIGGQDPHDADGKYTLKSDKTLEKWLFHPTYFTESTNFLPMSIQRELVRRLTTNTSNQVDPSKLKEINPIIQVKLANISAAYRNKQVRSRKASQDKLKKQGELQAEESKSVSPVDKYAEFHEFLSDFRSRRLGVKT